MKTKIVMFNHFIVRTVIFNSEDVHVHLLKKTKNTLSELDVKEYLPIKTPCVEIFKHFKKKIFGIKEIRVLKYEPVVFTNLGVCEIAGFYLTNKDDKTIMMGLYKKPVRVENDDDIDIEFALSEEEDSE